MWIALDDTSEHIGTLQYVRGSHKWKKTGKISEFHAPKEYDYEMRRVAAENGVNHPEIVNVEVPAGGTFHLQEIC